VVGVLPFVSDEPPMTRARALADRDALRRRDLNSYLPDAPENWERIVWDDLFGALFGEPDSLEDIDAETAVYLSGGKAIYVRIENETPSGPMVADLLQMQRYVEKGGDLSDLADYRATVSHIVDTVRTTAAGWSNGPQMKFGHFKTINGVSFVIGKEADPLTIYPDMRFYHGALGGGAVIKLRSEAPTADVVAILEGIDFDSLNHLQDVPHPLVGAGLPDFVIETPEEWLENRGFKLRKVERVIPVKEVEELASAEEDDDAKSAEKDSEDKKKKGH
jgi:hypothetical protein